LLHRRIEPVVTRAHDPDAQASRVAAALGFIVGHGRRDTRRVARVVTRDHAEHARGVAHVPRERPDLIER
jgi:hypothetical protein